MKPNSPLNSVKSQKPLLKMNQLIDGSGVVAVNDLLNQAGVHFLIARTYIEKFGGVLDEPPGVVCHEGYVHSYVDDEIRSTAKFHDRWAYANDAIVEHMHPGVGKSETDETYRIGENSMPQGRELYASRAHLWAV